jgi:glucokinase
MPARYLAIEIGGTKLQIVSGSATGTIAERQRLIVDRAKGGIGIRAQIERTLADLLPVVKPVAIGVGFGGPVDWKTGLIRCSHQIDGWCDFALADWLQCITQLPVKVENDANTAALGEALCGAGTGCNPVFYITLGSGVGGGLVVDGIIYHGAIPGEAELGHVRLDRNGTTVESRCSGWAVDQRIRALCAGQCESELAQLTQGLQGGEARHLARALDAGDVLARRILMEMADDLAFGLSHAVHLFHPERIILGGGLSLVGESLRAGVEQRLPAYVMEAFAPGPSIRLAALGEDAVPVGALLLAAQSHPDHPEARLRNQARSQ